MLHIPFFIVQESQDTSFSSYHCISLFILQYFLPLTHYKLSQLLLAPTSRYITPYLPLKNQTMLAFHPIPESIFNPSSFSFHSHTTNSTFSCPYITLHNPLITTSDSHDTPLSILSLKQFFYPPVYLYSCTSYKLSHLFPLDWVLTCCISLHSLTPAQWRLRGAMLCTWDAAAMQYQREGERRCSAAA